MGVVSEEQEDLPEFFDEEFEALVAGAGDRGDFFVGEVAAEFVEGVGVDGEVEFIGGDDFGFLGEFGAEGFEFAADFVVVLGGVGGILGVEVEEVDDDLGAFDVTEEGVAESCAVVSAFDESGDVCDDDSAVDADFDDAELWFEGSEGVVGDLGSGGGDGSEEGTFSGVGHSDEADVCDEFEFEFKAAVLSWGTGFGVAGRLVDGGSEMPVTAAAFSGLGDDGAFFRGVEVGEEDIVVVVVDEGAWRDADEEVVGAFSGHFFTHAVLAVVGVPVMSPREVEEGIFVGVSEEDDGSAIAAVAAVGSAFRDVLFTAEGDAAVTAVAGFDFDDGFVDEHGNPDSAKARSGGRPAVCLSDGPYL